MRAFSKKVDSIKKDVAKEVQQEVQKQMKEHANAMVDEKVRLAVASSGAQSASGWGASSGKSGGWAAPSSEPSKQLLSMDTDAQSMKESENDKREVRDKLELRFASIIDEADVGKLVSEALASLNVTLGSLDATIHSSFNKMHSGSTVVWLQFLQGPKPRTKARDEFAPKNADGKRDSQLKCSNGSVQVFIPLPKYQRARNAALFNARSLVADVCGKLETELDIDPRKRTVAIGGSVVVRQSIQNWSICIDEGSLAKFTD